MVLTGIIAAAALIFVIVQETKRSAAIGFRKRLKRIGATPLQRGCNWERR